MAAFHAIGLLHASCLMASALTAAVVPCDPASAQTPVKFALDFKIEGPAAPFLVAIDKGYFSAEGLDVTVEPGAGSLEPIGRVASGSHEFGFGDINALIRMRDQKPDLAVKPVFMVYNRPPFAIVGRKSRGVTVPIDLEGKKVGAPAGDAAFAQWPVFAKLNGIDPDKVRTENIGFAVREPILAAGQVDAVFGYSFSSYINLKERGVPVDDIVLMVMADHGLRLYGNAILVNAKFASEEPWAVRGFLRAFVMGLRDTIKDPASAIQSVIKRNELAKPEVELERLRMAIGDNVLTPEVKANGFGTVDSARLGEAIEQIALAYKFKTKPAPADVFDFSFLPPASERAAE